MVYLGLKWRSFRLVALLGAAAVAACGNGTGASLPLRSPLQPSPGSASPIAHVVLIVQENRSFDDFFARFPGADGAKRGRMRVKEGSRYVDKWVKLHPEPLHQTRDIQHCYGAYVKDYDGGAMDGFGQEAFGVCDGYAKLVGTWVYQYVRRKDIMPYWDLAEQYVLADHMFQTQGSGSFTAHQDLIRGGTAIDQSGSGSGYSESIIDNPGTAPWGCDAPAGVKLSLLTTSGKYERRTGPFPCSKDFPTYGSGGYKTLRDLLDAAGVTWKYYVPCFAQSDGCTPEKGCPNCAGDTLNAFDMIYPVRYGSEWSTNISMPETNIFTDITSGSLPAVSWVIAEDGYNDHPGDRFDKGPQWVASVVNAIGQSSYWNSSAIVIVWDDWGGYYDNAKPPFQDHQGGLGFRVPALIVSPYAIVGTSSQGGYISHTQYEFGSILKYIEQNFSLGSLHTTDERATSIGDAFNYNQSPRPFTAIPSALDPHYLITHARPSLGDPE